MSTYGSEVGRYLLIEVGCLECHIPTVPEGTYDTLEAAKAAAGGPTLVRPGQPSEGDWDGGDWDGASLWLIVDLEELPHE
jgi:hypothetical protein